MFNCCEHCREGNPLGCWTEDDHTDPCEFAAFRCGGDQLSDRAREASLDAMTKARALL